MKTAAVILAAGSSSRFGQPKPLLTWQGQTLLQRTCHIAQQAGHAPILVITAPDSPLLNKPLPDYAQRLDNPRHQEGMGTSLALAASVLAQVEIDALTVLLPDQPAITVANLLALQAALSPPDTTIVLSHSGEHTGPPTLFSRQHFPELTQLNDDQGGKEIVQKHLLQTKALSIPEAIWDIDTPLSWERFQKEHGPDSFCT